MGEQGVLKPPGATSAEPRAAVPSKGKPPQGGRIAMLAVLLAAAGSLGYWAWMKFRPAQLPEGFVSSNGRIEATEIDIATKLAGRVVDELVDEGNLVTAGQVVAHMDVDVLRAQQREAVAKLGKAKSDTDAARSTLAQRTSEKAAAEAVVAQREAELNLATANFSRAERMIKTGAIDQAGFDTYQASFFAAKAAVNSAKANVAASEAGIATARAEIIAAEATVASTQATIERIQADIDDGTLKAPKSGRVQYRVAQPGEVLPAGGKVLNMIDLNDVYMTFFLPTEWAGRVSIDAEARIVLDAAPQFVIPAKVTFVADVAQFTPKTVETAQERQKLTFRVKAHIPPDLLQRFVRDVKTGLPGMAYVRLDPQATWPEYLQVKLPDQPTPKP